MLCAVLESAGYVVGEANAPSGVFRGAAGDWSHLGWTNVRAFDLAVSDAGWFIGAGNGVLRSRDEGISWRVTTDWRITEVLSLHVEGSTVHAATAHGPWKSPDSGDTWRFIGDGLPPVSGSFCTWIGRGPDDQIWVGTEMGLFAKAGDGWRPAGLAGRPVRKVAVSGGEVWVATDGQGLWHSTDGGAEWSPILPGEPLYAVAASGPRIATAGYRTPVFVSGDAGATWQHLDVPATSVHALTWDAGGLWMGTNCGVFRGWGPRRGAAPRRPRPPGGHRGGVGGGG
ncbi:MAG: hypothetical protein AAGI08_16830, partial [Bacteroidota bacterium]